MNPTINTDMTGSHGCLTVQSEVAPGLWGPTAPFRASFWLQRKREKMCGQRPSGHHWHAADPMIRWFCCDCGADRDGWPKRSARSGGPVTT